MESKYRQRKGFIKGSYSIEMSILMPFIVMLLVSIVYLVFFLYDESVMQQTAYLAGLRGNYTVGSCEEYAGEAVQYGEECQKELWASRGNQVHAEAVGNKIKVQCEGRVATPFGGRFFMNTWGYKIEQQAEKKTPVQIIRNCRKLEGILGE